MERGDEISTAVMCSEGALSLRELWLMYQFPVYINAGGEALVTPLQSTTTAQSQYYYTLGLPRKIPKAMVYGRYIPQSE